MKRAHSTSSSSVAEDDHDDHAGPAAGHTEALPPSPAPTKKSHAPRTTKTKRATSDDVKVEMDDSDPEAEDVKPRPRKAKKPRDVGAPGEWTPEKRERLMDRIIENGYKHTDLAALAAELNLKPTQVSNQLTPGRKSNLRDKCVRYVGTDMK